MSTPFQLPECARSRIICVTNVHFNATTEEIKACFSNSVIEDIYRTTNVRTGKETIAYVLFSTITGENRALTMAITSVTVSPSVKAKIPDVEIVNEGGSAFINSKKATAEAAIGNLPSFTESNFPALGTPKVITTLLEAEGTSTAEYAVAETENGTFSMLLEPTQHAEEAGVRFESNNQSYHCSSPYQVPYLPIKDSDVLPPPPQNLQTWNLHGHDANDQSKNVAAPADWYNFKVDRFAKIEGEQRREGTNADRIPS
ncbi:hypothetical protein DE146DRAFT_637045 [Phaeosphaeria sp. MPI-PUGE-AT-0046c]|nr:hypothetical protein DE146DRAFT_637045 [Phaeosphaeria sp. MPI-PUGE-AT-0046c]